MGKIGGVGRQIGGLNRRKVWENWREDKWENKWDGE